jgi:outer membrane murein-binding lipoprotein Lpp
VEARDRRIEDLESKLDAAQSDRDDLEATVSDLRAERDELQRRVDELESDLAAAETDAATADRGATDLDPAAALAGTNLFVRYDSKGNPTLQSIAEGSVDPDAVNDNLRLEHHTQFDLEDATVNGDPFEQFLHDSGRYRFVEWVVRALPYELLNSGATTELQDVYDAVPAFDRIEFDGVVDVEGPDGESARHEFDVVVRDRMGEPLVVAEINASRDPVHEDAMEGLVSGATAIGEAVESLAGAFYVTSSFFEPGALERAQAAASAGGFFSRSDRESYVKVSRKRGYHLCLVEDRHDAFHLTVPEL